MSVNKVTGATARVGKLVSNGAITAADLNTTTVTFVVGAEAGNAINIAMTFKDGAGTVQAVPKAGLLYLSTDAAGLTPATTPPQTSLLAGTNGKLTKWTANLSGFFVTTAAGLIDVNITDTGTPTFYVVVVLPNGGLAVSGAVTFA